MSSPHDVALQSERDLAVEKIAASRAFDAAVGSVVHDLRAPVAGIIAAAHLLAGEGPDNELCRRLVEIVGRSERAIDDLIADLISRAKIHLPDPPPPRVEVELMSVLGGLADIVAIARDVQVEVDVDVEHATIWTVETTLSRIVLNLLDNAARHSGARSISLSLQTTGSGIEVSIADRGTGLPPSITRWLAGDDHPASAADDLGLGLSTAVGLASELGGSLAHDESWNGTRLVLSLPQREADVDRPRGP